jgi:urease accessory protein
MTEPPAAPRALLQLMWLASPALPVGAFSYSEVLESAVETGRVTTEAAAGHWLLDQLQLGVARADMAVAAQAIVAWDQHDFARIGALNDWVRQTRESAELRQQTEQMGRSLVEWLRNGGSGGNVPAQPHGGEAANATATPPAAATTDPRIAVLAALRPAPTWPVAFALAAALTDASPRDALLSFAFGWAENMVQAAMKAVPLGQSAAQRMLARLAAATPAAVAHALALQDDERQVCTPMLAILSAQHEVQYSRLFRS